MSSVEHESTVEEEQSLPEHTNDMVESLELFWNSLKDIVSVRDVLVLAVLILLGGEF